MFGCVLYILCKFLLYLHDHCNLVYVNGTLVVLVCYLYGVIEFLFSASYKMNVVIARVAGILGDSNMTLAIVLYGVSGFYLGTFFLEGSW